MDYLLELNQIFRAAFAWFGNTRVFGITLDIPAHIFGGALLYYLFAWRGFRPLLCLALTLGLECLKEVYDSSAVYHAGDYLEPLKDFSTTAIGAALGHYLSRPVPTQVNRDHLVRPLFDRNVMDVEPRKASHRHRDFGADLRHVSGGDGSGKGPKQRD